MTERTEGSATTTTQRVEQPLVPAWRKKELVCLLDTSGSMEWEAGPPQGSHPSRHEVVAEALPLLVAALEKEDSAAEGEQAGGSDEKGGLLIHGFASVHTELGDFNSSNFQRRWDAIRWGGGTTIMPAWKAALEDFNEEFGDDAEPPALLTLVVTDGEASDASAFAKVLAEKHQGRYFAVAIVGHGPEYDKVLASYQQAAKANAQHVTVIPLGAVTDPHEIAADLITMAGIGG